MRRRRIEGWDSWQRQTDEGAVESQQRITIDRPVVEFDAEGARRLGETYWREVERVTLGVVRMRARTGRHELRVFGRRPVLLRFGEPQLEVSNELVRCRYPIAGGALARRAEGEIDFVQRAGDPVELSTTVRDFFPALAAREGRPHWTGALYGQVQSRIHVIVSRRYFARLLDGT